MKKYIFLLLLSSLVLFGCQSNDTEHPLILKINDVEYPYNESFIYSIDESRYIDKSNPPTVKSVKPDRLPDFKIEVWKNKNLSESYYLWDENGHYLIDITKGSEHFWLALEGEVYYKAQTELTRYK